MNHRFLLVSLFLGASFVTPQLLWAEKNSEQGKEENTDPVKAATQSINVKKEEYPYFHAAEGPTKRLNEDTEYEQNEEIEEKDADGHSIPVHILLYIPNRVLDILDIVRLRARVGPGIGAQIRITEPVSLNLGSYMAVYAGLPGPRIDVPVRSPIGAEIYAGARASIFGWETEDYGPDYSPTEVGLGVHAALLGLDVGIDPVEIVDFLAGLLFLDIRDDDL